MDGVGETLRRSRALLFGGFEVGHGFVVCRASLRHGQSTPSALAAVLIFITSRSGRFGSGAEIVMLIERRCRVVNGVHDHELSAGGTGRPTIVCRAADEEFAAKSVAAKVLAQCELR